MRKKINTRLTSLIVFCLALRVQECVAVGLIIFEAKGGRATIENIKKLSGPLSLSWLDKMRGSTALPAIGYDDSCNEGKCDDGGECKNNKCENGKFRFINFGSKHASNSRERCDVGTLFLDNNTFKLKDYVYGILNSGNNTSLAMVNFLEIKDYIYNKDDS
jgi:hypothetical protein